MVAGFSTTHQGPLFSFDETTLFNLDHPTPGSHTFYFLVDTNMNGALDLEALYWDSVTVVAAER
ncbi:MAG: hypothetical protein GY859_13170 [Desulfobacterales bacterium]|nr:hypothetical protein [Desulfobacterales bacterium]